MLTFFACGWSTNGLIVTHLLPAASDVRLSTVAAAGLIAVIGSFDMVGTIAAGWLTDRMSARLLLAATYAVRGIALVPLANLLTAQIGLPLWAWTVFYGLAWTATVPPTVELCRRHMGADDSGIAFGWIYAAHMIGAGAGAYAAGILRQATGSYTAAWWVGAAVCLGAAALTLTLPPARGIREFAVRSEPGRRPDARGRSRLSDAARPGQVGATVGTGRGAPLGNASATWQCRRRPLGHHSTLRRDR